MTASKLLTCLVRLGSVTRTAALAASGYILACRPQHSSSQHSSCRTRT
jgi:hypothetical protein